MDGFIRLSSGDNFTNLLGPKLGNNAQINLEGCSTALGTNNISTGTSKKFSNASVRDIEVLG